jgi:polyhydroxyalkanoate synthesis regulator phasin
MKLSTILIGGAVLVGLGFYLSRKFSAKNNEDESFVYATEKETHGEKIRKASMYAVGAIKTSADKIAEGIKDIRSQDMVKKGEKTLESAKEACGDFVDSVKEKVSSIVKNADVDIDVDINLGDDDGAEGSDDFFMANEDEN